VKLDTASWCGTWLSTGITLRFAFTFTLTNSLCEVPLLTKWLKFSYIGLELGGFQGGEHSSRGLVGCDAV
jgi:hypothetical protein